MGTTNSHRLSKEVDEESTCDRTPLIDDDTPRNESASASATLRVVDDQQQASYGTLQTLPLVKSAQDSKEETRKQENGHSNHKNAGLRSDDEEDDASYMALLKRNRELRLYICSLLVTNCGEWLSYIASIDLIETKLASLNQESRTAVSILVLVRLLPNVFFSSFGGILADKYDRRQLMMGLDLASALATLLFLVAYELQSITIVYVASFVQQVLCGLYQPSSYSIIPMLVHDDDQDLKKATTMQGLVWSAMQAFGAALSGFVVSAFGVRTCFLLDSATFLVSSLFIWMVRGEYKALPEKGKDDTVVHSDDSNQNTTSYADGVKYLFNSYFAALIFIKACAGLSYGASDVLNVVLSERHDDGADNLDSDLKLGVMFFFVGIGSLIGPLVTEPFVDAELPATLQLSCVLSFAAASIGYAGWYWGGASFYVLCGFAVVRAAGASVIWIHSSILLQKFSSTEMMGRIMSMDYAAALSAEALSAYLCGHLIDQYGFSFHQVTFGLTIISLFSTVFWFAYHFSGRGAMKYKVPGTANGQRGQGGV